MSGSAIATSTYQGLASNIYNADKTTPIYNGGWDFKNASGVNVFQNTSNTGTGTDNCNLLIKADNRNSSMTCDVPVDTYISSFIGTVAGTEKARLFYRQTDKTWQIQGDGTTVWGTCINGAWTFGPSSGYSTIIHAIYGNTILRFGTSLAAANGGSYALTITPSYTGTLTVKISGAGTEMVARVIVTGGAITVAIAQQPLGAGSVSCSTVQGTASKLNFYFATGSYRVENTTGIALTLNYILEAIS